MKTYTAVAALAALMLLSTQSAFAQQGQQADEELKALTKEIQLLKEGQKAMQQDLQEIKRLLLARGAPSTEPAQPEYMSMGDDLFQGSKDAKVVLIDFSDYQCPFCGRFVRETMPQLEREYIKTGKLKYVFRDLPLEEIHPFAFKAAESARCAGEQGKFWEMHYRLFANQQALDASSLPSHAKALGLDVTKFTQCLDSDRFDTLIRKDMADAESAGIQGTPNFLIGLVNPNNPRDPNVKVLKMITGAQPYAVFKAAVESALAAQK